MDHNALKQAICGHLEIPYPSMEKEYHEIEYDPDTGEVIRDEKKKYKCEAIVNAIDEVITHIQTFADINTTAATITAQVVAGSIPGPGTVLPVPAGIVTVPNSQPIK